MENPYLSIIIPVNDKSECISKTLIDIDYRLSEISFDYEIIVISDGSLNISKIMSGMMRMVKKVKFIDNKENKKKGEIIRQGMLSAIGDIRLLIEADNLISINQFGAMIPFLSGNKEKYDIVVGSRKTESILNSNQFIYKTFLRKLSNFFIQIILLWGVSDAQCGFKAFTKESAIKIFNISKIDNYGFDIEALSLAKKLGLKIKEVPIDWKDDELSHKEVHKHFKILSDVIKIRYWLWFDKYKLKDRNI